MIERRPEDWIRRADRRRTSVTGAAYRSDGSWARVHISNISYEGCQLLSSEPLDIGETLRLVMPNTREMRAQVRWGEDVNYGVRFISGEHVLDERRARLGI